MTAPTQQAPAPDVTAGQVATYALEAAVAAKAVQMAIRAALMRDVIKLWPALDKARLSETFPGWLRAMSLLITNYRGQSSFAAGRFYRQARAEALGSPAPASLIKLAGDPDPQWLARALGFAGPGMLSKDTAQPNTALATTLGTASRITLDGARSTVAETVKKDRAAVGWWFKTDGDPCHWCAMIASRGIVYKEHSLDRSNAKFIGDGTAKVHNKCGCGLAPAFSRSQPLDEINHIAEDVYVESTKHVHYTEAVATFREGWDLYNSLPPSSPEERMAAFRPAWQAYLDAKEDTRLAKLAAAN